MCMKTFKTKSVALHGTNYKEISKKALRYAGLRGGYYNVPDPKITDDAQDMPMYTYLSQNTSPSLLTIEAQISEYIKEQLPICINSLEFENTQLTGQLNWVKSAIVKDKVIVRANYPLSLQRADLTLIASDFSSEIPLRLDAIYGIALEIAESQLKNKGTLCVDCIAELAEKNNFDIDVDLEEKNLVFTIFDNAVTIDGDSYVFSFATD